MDAVVESLLLDLLEWVAGGGKPYDEVMEAWRTSCPRLPVWQEANERGFVAREAIDNRSIVRITLLGFAFLCQRRALLKAVSVAGS
jgi:hypothetical protein